MSGVKHRSSAKKRGDPSIIYTQHQWCSCGKLKHVEILKSASVIGNDQFQMLRLDFARFIAQDATLKCGNNFLSLSTRLLTGSCTYDWLKLKARSALGGRDLVRNLYHRYRAQINNRQSGCIQFPQCHCLFKSESEMTKRQRFLRLGKHSRVFSSFWHVLKQPALHSPYNRTVPETSLADKRCVHTNFSIHAHL